MKTNFQQRNKTIWLFLVIVSFLLLSSQDIAAQWTQNGNDVYKTNTAGNVGIGTTSPNAKLEILSGSITIQPAASGRFMLINDPTWGNAGSFETTSGGDIHLKAYSSTFATPQLFLKNGGNVGIGTTAPLVKTHVVGSLYVAATETNTVFNGAVSGNSSSVLIGPSGYWALRSGTAHDFNLDVYNGGASLSAITVVQSGNVGIGTSPNSAYRLDVAGNINSSATITGSNIVAKYQDVAEWVSSSEQLSAATVVVLDTTKPNQVVGSSQAYDTRVAGVISAQPGITLGEKGDGKVLVATTGRVRVRVDASRGAIHIGDLLVTSDVPGVAMRSEAVNLGGVQIHRPGTIIGKALEPLAKGSGEILVLLSLQ